MIIKHGNFGNGKYMYEGYGNRMLVFLLTQQAVDWDGLYYTIMCNAVCGQCGGGGSE